MNKPVHTGLTPPAEVTETAAHESEERFRTLFEAMDEAFCLIELLYDADGKACNYRFLETNPAFERQSGLVDAVGKTILDLVPEFETSWFATYAEISRTGIPLRFESEFKSMAHWFDVHASRADSRGRISILFKDITDRKRAEANLIASEERYRSLFESIDEGFCLIEMLYDEHGKPCDYFFLQVNPAFCRQTGLKDVVGTTARAAISGLEQLWVDHFARVVETGAAVRFIADTSALNRTFDVYANRAGPATSKRVSIVFTDITERKRAEDELRDLAAQLSEVDRRKNEFLATLAHELRNPLAPLSNGLSIVQQLNSDDAQFSSTMEMMERQVRHMTRLVDDLLDVARISTGKLELKRTRSDIQSVLALALESSMHLIAEKQHVLRQQIAADPIYLDIDTARIAQVLSNLLNNAAKYSPPESVIHIALTAPGSEVVIVIADSGVGIPLAAQGSIFDMFTQISHNDDMSQGGLGIGLSLVRKLVELHGGKVSAESAGKGLGSKFTVRLPLPDASAPMLPITAATLAAPTSIPLRILVVDDNADAADTLSMLLDMANHTTQVCYDGHTALQLVKTFCPQIVFLDIGLPGLSGYEVARAIKHADMSNAPVLVALTGWGAEADRARALNAGFDHHLTKPTQLDAVNKLILTISSKLSNTNEPR